MGEFAHLLQIFEDGQFRTHFHLRSQDLLHELGGLVEFAAEMCDFGVSEEIFEVVDGGLGVAEELDLLSLL